MFFYFNLQIITGLNGLSKEVVLPKGKKSQFFEIQLISERSTDKRTNSFFFSFSSLTLSAQRATGSGAASAGCEVPRRVPTW